MVYVSKLGTDGIMQWEGVGERGGWMAAGGGEGLIRDGAGRGLELVVLLLGWERYWEVLGGARAGAEGGLPVVAAARERGEVEVEVGILRLLGGM